MRDVTEADIRWLWAAYKMGTYKEILPEHMNDDMFTETVLDVIESSDLAFMIDGPGEDGIRPIGIVLARIFAKGNAIEPHVDWFPWATGRNKMEGSATFLRQVKRQFKIFLFIDQPNLKFWERICQYRLLTKGCKVIDHYGPGEHAMMYYTTGT